MTTAMTFHALDDVSLEVVRDAMAACGGALSGDLQRTWDSNRVVNWTFGDGTRVSWCGIFRLGESVLLVEGDPAPCAAALDRLPVIEVASLIAALDPRSAPEVRVRAARRLAAVKAPWSEALEVALAQGLDDDDPGVRQSFAEAALFVPWGEAEDIVRRLSTRRPDLVPVLEMLAAPG